MTAPEHLAGLMCPNIGDTGERCGVSPTCSLSRWANQQTFAIPLDAVEQPVATSTRTH